MTTPPQQGVFTYRERATLVSFALLSFVLGFVGYHSYYESTAVAATFSDLAYMAVNLFFIQLHAKGNIPITLDVARWLAPTTLSYALIKTAMLLVQNKLLRYQVSHLTDHAIIIGLSDRSVNIALSFSQHGIKTVVIDSLEHNQYWGEMKQHKILHLVANTSDNSLLENVNVTKANYLFACTASDNTNLNIIYSAFCKKQALAEAPILHSVCKIEEKTLLNALNDRHLFAIDYNFITTRTLHYNLMIARWMVNEFGPHKYITNFSHLDGLTILIAGDNVFTAELIVRLVEIGIYGCALKLRIILLGKHADRIYHDITNMYPAIIELASINVKTCKRYDEKQYQDFVSQSTPNIVYVCPSETGDKLLTLKTLTNKQKNIPVVVCETDNQHSFEWLKSEFAASENINFVNINSAISHYEDVFENRLDRAAIAIHLNYIQQRLAIGETASENPSLVQWNDLPESLKNANRNQADHIAIKCHYLMGKTHVTENEITAALSVETKLALAKMEHQRWITEKKLSGWQYSLSEKDPINKVSPSLIEWNELSENEQHKDIEAVEHLAELVEISNRTRNSPP